MGFKGSVESVSLANVFQNLAMNQQTGTLRVYTAEGHERLIFFQSGNVQSLSPGAGKPLLCAEMFLARGYLSQNMLEAALTAAKEMARSAIDLLVEQGALTATQVNEVFKLYVEEELYDLFRWEKASFEFNNDPPAAEVFPAPHGSEILALPVSHLIMEAARRVDEWERLRKLVPSFKEIYTLELTARKAIAEEKIETDPIEKRLLGLIDCAHDVEDLIADSFLSRFEVLSALARLRESSVVRPAEVAELAQAEQECLRLNLPARRIKVLERQSGQGRRKRQGAARTGRGARQRTAHRTRLHPFLRAGGRGTAARTPEARPRTLQAHSRPRPHAREGA